MKKNGFKFFGLIAVAVIGLITCKKEKVDEIDLGKKIQEETFTKSRKEILTHLADNIIIPSYNRFKISLDSMTLASEAFASSPNETSLKKFRMAWQNAYIEWQKVELFDIGPADSYTIRYFFNIYPTNVEGINSNIQKSAVNLELPDNFACQGFPALDYLINGVAATDAAILNYYTTAADASKRIAYIKLIVSNMNSFITRVITEWNGDYKTTFAEKSGTDIGSSFSQLVNATTLHYERYIRSAKFGIPSGAMMNGIVAANKVEAFYKKDISGILAKTAHQSYIDMFNGKSVVDGKLGLSLKYYLDAIDAKDLSSGKMLSEIINSQMEVCQLQIESLSSNFYETIQANNQVIKDTYSNLQKSTKYIKVDMSSAMSITITYTDNDGD